MTQPYPIHPQLQGNFAPIRMEADIDDLVIEGELPRSLEVAYYRNGPDPQFPPRGEHHWFTGDGMLHQFVIAEGKVRYRNRWLRTVKWHKEREAGRSLFGAFNPMDADPSVAGIETDGLANTNVIWHGGRLLALEEGHAPFEVDSQTLESIGPWRFDDTFEGPMTAHPKIDPVTGEMIFFGYMVDGVLGKGLSYQVVNADGVLTRSERFEAPISSMVHDFIVTSEHVIFPILPLTGSVERAMRGEPAFAWEPEKGSHIGVMPRDGSVKDIRWYETDPCYVFHPMNAMTSGNTIRAHVMQFEGRRFSRTRMAARPIQKRRMHVCANGKLISLIMRAESKGLIWTILPANSRGLMSAAPGSNIDTDTMLHRRVVRAAWVLTRWCITILQKTSPPVMSLTLGII